MTFAQVVLSISLLNFVLSASAANCNTDQPRKEGDPSAQQISDALRGPNDSLIDSVCNGGFPPGSDTVSTFNSGSLLYNVSRTDANQPLQYCSTALIDIIEQCITGDNYWGGDWEDGDEVYAIYDQSWPSHILPAESSVSTSTSTSASASVSASESASESESASASSSAQVITTPPGATTIITSLNGSPVTETFVPTTIIGITQPTTSSTTIGGTVFPLSIGVGGIAWIPFIPPGGAPPPVIPPPGIPPPGIPDGDGDGGNDPTSTKDSSSLSSSSSSTQATITPDETYVGNTACGTDSDAATRTTTFSKKSTAATRPPSQTVTKGCTICVLPAGSLDPACQPISGCIDTQTTPTTASAPPATTAANTTPTAVFPTATGVNCGTDSTGGARLSDCLAILGSVASGDKICTSDEGRCQKSGNSLSGNPQVETSSFCQIGQNSGCAFVVANKLSSFGFPGSSCFTGSQIDNFIRIAANQCNSGNNAYAIAQGPSSFDSFCLLSQDDPGLCGA